MLKIDQAQQDAAGRHSRTRFAQTLASELRGRFPERFGMLSPEQLDAHVDSRIKLALSCRISRERDVASFARCEAARGEDFSALPEGHPVRSILASDRPGELKARQINSLTFALETAPGFKPSEFD